jgi:hypothetical protein
MKTSKNPNPEKTTSNREDTEAILDRRKFLIQAALAGAGAGAVLSGCKPEEPQPCLTPAPPKPPTNPPPPAPGPCLEVAAPATNPVPLPPKVQVCLSIAVPAAPRTNKP